VALERVVWIGGSTASGKSSIADYLADRFGLAAYHVDRRDREHEARRDPSRHPAIEAWASRTLDETWVDLPVPELVEATLAFSRERFELVLDDLAELARGGAVVAEGFQLLPELVAPLLGCPRQGVWLVSTDRFRLEALQRRGTAWQLPKQTSNPARALQNRLDRDEAIAERVRAEAQSRGLKVIEVSRQPLSVVATEVETHLFPAIKNAVS
jgi:chloramphenicol 3-O-phosphotransferase